MQGAWFRRTFVGCWLLAITGLALGSQHIELYRAKHRPAAELVSIAESALGADGEVTLDSRTATLVLNGSPAAIQRALTLLERMDRPLRQIVVESEVRRIEDRDAFAIAVAWKTSLGPVRIGTLPLSRDGLAVAVGGARSSRTARARSRLRLTEGGTGVVRTGTALPVLFQPYWGTVTTTFVPVETGFEVQAQVLERDRVHLELRPFAGRFDRDGELDYIAAATSITVSPGETVVLAETTRDTESATTDLSGVQKSRDHEEQIVLITVDLDR